MVKKKAENQTMKDLGNFFRSDSDTVCWPLSFTPPLMILLTHSFLKIEKKLPRDFLVQPKMTAKQTIKY